MTNVQRHVSSETPMPDKPKKLPKLAKTLDGTPHHCLSFARARLYGKMGTIITDYADDEHEVREAPGIAKKWLAWSEKQRGFAIKEVERWKPALEAHRAAGEEIPEEWEVD